MTHPPFSVRDLFALAYLDGLNRTARDAAVRPVNGLSPWVALDDTGRAPVVPLRATGGQR